MGICSTRKKHQSKVAVSSYHTRTTYLQAMKQFMADNNNASQSQTNGGIEEYLQYEKQMSHHIQKLLNHIR